MTRETLDMKLSVIVVSYNMSREIPRTLASLSRSYQRGAETLEYEVILVDNGSSQPPLPSSWDDIDVPLVYLPLTTDAVSPARAINTALDHASGEVICLMIDGAHVLTPGVFELALRGFRAFDSALVAVRYFWLGPAAQNVSVLHGYTQDVEDRLIDHVGWPGQGYRLFEIGVPFRFGDERMSWMNQMFESNCLFLTASMFEALGGADERFVSKGGGMINSDIYKRACELPGVAPVQLIGEGSFHQLHGGTTTNVPPQECEALVEHFMQEYEALRGHRTLTPEAAFFYLGHQPSEASKIHRPWRQGFAKAMRSVGMQDLAQQELAH